MNLPHDGGPISASIDTTHKGSLIAHGGLTIRDWFAGMALQAIVSKNPCETVDVREVEHDQMTARGAYGYADAMIAARSKGGAP